MTLCSEPGGPSPHAFVFHSDDVAMERGGQPSASYRFMASDHGAIGTANVGMTGADDLTQSSVFASWKQPTSSVVLPLAVGGPEHAPFVHEPSVRIPGVGHVI